MLRPSMARHTGGDMSTYEQQDEPSEEQVAFWRQKVASLTDGLEQLGLYAKHAEIGRLGSDVDDDQGFPAAVFTLRVGDVAWTDRVQAPEAERQNDEFRALEADVVRDAGLSSFLELRDRLDGDEDGEGEQHDDRKAG